MHSLIQTEELATYISSPPQYVFTLLAKKKKKKMTQKGACIEKLCFGNDFLI